MKTIRTAVVALALAGALAACSTPAGPDTGTSATAGSTATSTGAASGTAAPGTTGTTPGDGVVGPDEQAVEIALRAYQNAIALRDFPIACALNAPEASQQLVLAVQSQGGQVGTCEEAFTLVFAQPGAIEAAVESAQTTTVQEVTVTGTDATITYTSTVQGQASTVTNILRAIDGQWRLVGAA